MEHNIIQMTATTGFTVPHSINPIFQYIFNCLGFNPIIGNFDFVFQGLNQFLVVIRAVLSGRSEMQWNEGNSKNVINYEFFSFPVPMTNCNFGLIYK